MAASPMLKTCYAVTAIGTFIFIGTSKYLYIIIDDWKQDITANEVDIICYGLI